MVVYAFYLFTCENNIYIYIIKRKQMLLCCDNKQLCHVQIPTLIPDYYETAVQEYLVVHWISFLVLKK